MFFSHGAGAKNGILLPKGALSMAGGLSSLIGRLLPIRKKLLCLLASLGVLLVPLSASEFPGVFQEIIAPSVPGNWRNSEASMVKLNDGRLLVAWTDFYGPQEDDCDCKPARISAVMSGDEGRTWGKRFTLQENIAKQNVNSPSLLHLKSGKLLFVFIVNNSLNDARVMVSRLQRRR